MLAQNFLPASALGGDVTEIERDALIKTLALFERGEVTEISPAIAGHSDAPGFSMEFTFSICGTPRCILGHADALAGLKPFGIKKLAFVALGFPQNGRAYDATVEQAACALRNFLTTGDPQWAVALA
jgi:hypothetical protein